MPRPNRITIAPAAADANGLVAGQTATGAATLSMSGALVSGGVGTFDIPRHVSITCTGNNSGDTFTVVGTDRHGNAISETIAGPNNGTTLGTLNFKTITSVSVGSALSGNVDVGSADRFESAWWPTDHMGPNEFNVGVGVDVSGTGIPFKVQHTFADVQASGFQESDPMVLDHGDFATGYKTADYDGQMTLPVSAMRVAVDNFTTGTLTRTFIQQG